MSRTPDTGRYPRTARTRLKRRPERAHYDVETVHAILDAGLICHVAYVIDAAPRVTATAYWREDDRVYWHGAAAGTGLRAQSGGIPVAFTVTHCDGLVLARSAFHHSINYRSVTAYGLAEPVTDVAEKRRQMDLFMTRLGRHEGSGVRPPNPRELRVTTVMSLRLEEVVAKVRSGPPKDDAADMGLSVWAGVVPYTTRVGRPVPDAGLAAALQPPRTRRLPRN